MDTWLCARGTWFMVHGFEGMGYMVLNVLGLVGYTVWVNTTSFSLPISGHSELF